MKQMINEMSYFLKNKLYIIMVSFVAIFSYGFTVTHPAIGIDDTAIPLYFEDGFAACAGRWVLYIINKVLFLADFIPWMTEVVSVIIFVLSVTLWCVLLRRIVGERVPIWGYAIFSSLFISCPLISEVFVYYLHNGICIGYGVTALSLLGVLEAVKKGNSLKKTIGYAMVSASALCIAIGLYESFIIVFIIGMFMIFFLIRLQKEDKDCFYAYDAVKWIGVIIVSVIGALVLRTFIVKIITFVFQLEIPADVRGYEYRGIFNDLQRPLYDTFMILKKFVVMYYLNAFCYLPITVYVISICVLLLVGICLCVKKKDIFLFLAMLAIPIVPVLVPILEGYPTHYRASQYVPLIGAFAVFVLMLFLTQNKYSLLWKRIVIIASMIIVWNQCIDMNKWFYVDYLKYEDAKQVMNTIMYDLEREHDVTKPIVFRGGYLVPYEIAKEAYLDFDSNTYQVMSAIADVIDPHLLEKFNAEDQKGYVFTQTPINSTLRWGITAFDNTSGQLKEFWAMHGHSIEIVVDQEIIEEAEQLRNDMPAFPREGYIKEQEDYIIVNLY